MGLLLCLAYSYLYRKRDDHRTPVFHDGELEEPAKETEMRTFVVERRSRRSQETGGLSKGVSVNRCLREAVIKMENNPLALTM